MTAPDPANWSCQIGEIPRELLEGGADGPMREAVEKAYEELTGRECDFIFSGWGHPLPEKYRAVVENRLPEQDPWFTFLALVTEYMESAEEIIDGLQGRLGIDMREPNARDKAADEIARRIIRYDVARRKLGCYAREMEASL